MTGWPHLVNYMTRWVLTQGTMSFQGVASCLPCRRLSQGCRAENSSHGIWTVWTCVLLLGLGLNFGCFNFDAVAICRHRIIGCSRIVYFYDCWVEVIWLILCFWVLHICLGPWLFLVGNGMHVPMMTAWFHYVLSRTVRRDRFYQICKNPTVVKSWSEPPDELFEDIEFTKVA